MVSKHVCGYEQKLTRIYDYGYIYDKRGNLVKEEEICSPTTTGPSYVIKCVSRWSRWQSLVLKKQRSK